MKINPQGSKNAKIVLVGEAPGEDEERYQKLLVGPASQLLRQQASTAGVSLDFCYATNVAKERPPGNNFQARYYTGTNLPSTELLGLYDSLRTELSELKPNVIVAVGEEALKALTGREGIYDWRGSILETELGKVIPIISPGHCLRAAGADNDSILEGKTKGKHTFGDLNARAIFDWAKIGRESRFPEANLPSPNHITHPTFHDAMDYLRSIKKGDAVAQDIEVINYEIDCIGVSSNPLHAICIPFFYVNTGLGRPGEDYWTLEQEAAIWRELYRINSDPDITNIFQNANFDLHFLQYHGINLHHLGMDTMNAGHVCYPECPKSLDFLVSVYTRRPYHKDQIRSNRWLYNCHDASSTREIYDALNKELHDLGLYDFYYSLINEVVLPYKECADIGLNVDLEMKAKITRELEEAVAKVNQEAQEVIGHEINLASSTQVKALLYEEMGLAVQKKKPAKGEKEGKITSDDAAIKKLQKLYSKDSHVMTVLDLLDRHRDYSKELGTYARINLDPDNRCRTTYFVSGTETGRLSSQETVTGTGTNLQNPPKGELFKGCGYGIRSFFIPDHDGDIFLEGDLSGADARIVAWDAQDPGLISVFSSGRDVHITNASIFSGLSYDKIWKDYHRAEELEALGEPLDPDAKAAKTWRKKAKTCGHAANYGIRKRTLAQNLGITEAEAEKLLNLYYAFYPRIQAWHLEIQAQLQATRTLVTPLGRKRVFFGRWGEDLFKEAYAYKPQSTVADIIHTGFLRLYRGIKEHGLDKRGVRIALNNHDALAVNTPRVVALEVFRLMKQTMQVELSFPHGKETVPVDFKLGETMFGLRSFTEEELASWARPTKTMIVRENGRYVRKVV
jgi:uracil-DNA glycosylase family 4